MKYATFCTGIGAFECAANSVGWDAVFSSEIAPFPCKVLKHHYPNTPNIGDMTKINGKEYTGTIDVICAGTPCQSFSVAGLRAGLDDDRGNLSFEFCRLVGEIRPKWFVWENVPGVLSSNKGRDFGAIIGAMVQLGYGIAYRILDAKYFGVPQQRRRVFVVGHSSGDWRKSAQVLFEQTGGGGHTTEGASKKKEITAYTPSGFGGYSNGVGTLKKNGGDLGGGSETLVVWPPKIAPTLTHSYGRLQGQDNQHIDGGAGLFTFQPKATVSQGVHLKKDAFQTLDKSKVAAVMIPVSWIGRKDENGSNSSVNELSQTLTKSDVHAICDGYTVRRITPLEAGRLQGFPDNYTKIFGDKTPDQPQYEAYGNSMCVNVMKWICERIQKEQNNIYQQKNNK